MASINWPILFNNCQDNDLRIHSSSVLPEAWSQMTTSTKKKAFVSNDDSIVILATNLNNTIAVLHSFRISEALLFVRSTTSSALLEQTNTLRSLTCQCLPSQPPSTSQLLPSTTSWHATKLQRSPPYPQQQSMLPLTSTVVALSFPLPGSSLPSLQQTPMILSI